MPIFELKPHPDHAGTAIERIEVDAFRTGLDMIEFEFALYGDVGTVLWPDLEPQAFTDGLWQHTCCEAFVRVAGRPDYVELNITSSMLWAAYAFDSYRSGMTDLRSLKPCSTAGTGMNPTIVQLSIRLPALAEPTDWHVGLSAVIEETDGTKSYWALAHASGPPDFHNPACFTATLPPPDRA